MKSTKLLMPVIGLLVLAVSMVNAPRVYADTKADQDAYQREVDKDIIELEEKINQIKLQNTNQDKKVDLKVQEYQDRIAELKRESSIKKDKMEDRKTFQDRISEVRRDFYEWRFNNAIESYNKKIADLRVKSAAEIDVTKKRNIDQEIDQLEAKNTATKAKLGDLKVTDGKNWDVIQKDLDNSLDQIDREYKTSTEVNTNTY